MPDVILAVLGRQELARGVLDAAQCITALVGRASIIALAVDAPPPEKCREFVQVAGLLRDADVNVPQILETDFDAGFMLVTDLGTTTYLSVLDEKNARPLMRSAIDTLIKFQVTSREGVLPLFDEAFLRREMELMPEWFVARHVGHTLDVAERKVLDDTFSVLVQSALAQPQVFMLRDFSL